ncbi:MAG: hypothetical protein ACRDBO_15595 [Lachnospiraceae bacterium]
MSNYVSFSNETEVTLGGMPFTKIHCSGINIPTHTDIYIYSQDNGFMLLVVSYQANTAHQLQATLDTLKRLQ